MCMVMPKHISLGMVLLCRYWGEHGYVHISRDHHACGITTDAIYAVVEQNDDSAASLSAEE